MRKSNSLAAGAILLACLASSPFIARAADADAAPATASAIVTVEPAHKGQEAKPLIADNLLVYTGKDRARVTAVEPLEGSRVKTQLFIYLDDSTREGALGPRISELKDFVSSLPPNVEIGIGYMRNGAYNLVQPFTSDHKQAAQSVRLPQAIPGVNGSPYFALSYLVKHWPSQEQTDRRVVLMLTDGVDRYYENNFSQDPYVDAAIKDSQHFGVLVYSIYFRGSGLYDEHGWGQNMSQSRLIQVSQATGGQAYFEEFNTPISLTPYLQRFEERLNRQYRVTFIANRNAGLQKVNFRSEVPGIKISGPEEVLVTGSGS
ncbi:MAG: hypothetical protein WAM39_27045 [Bryobacteraceae bacterium]